MNLVSPQDPETSSGRRLKGPVFLFFVKNGDSSKIWPVNQGFFIDLRECSRIL